MEVQLRCLAFCKINVRIIAQHKYQLLRLQNFEEIKYFIEHIVILLCLNLDIST